MAAEHAEKGGMSARSLNTAQLSRNRLMIGNTYLKLCKLFTNVLKICEFCNILNICGKTVILPLFAQILQYFGQNIFMLTRKFGYGFDIGYHKFHNKNTMKNFHSFWKLQHFMLPSNRFLCSVKLRNMSHRALNGVPQRVLANMFHCNSRICKDCDLAKRINQLETFCVALAANVLDLWVYNLINLKFSV